MIIDSHVHIGKTEKSKRGFTLESYYNLMKKSGIDKSIVMSNVSNIISTSILNDQLIDEYLSSDLKERFFPLIIIDPKDRVTLKQIELYKNIIYGLKFHPSISETTIDSPEMIEFISCSDKLNFPILVHCGRHWRSNIKYLVKVAKKFENINFIAAHLAGNATDIIEKSIDILGKEKLSNIYLDTSAGKLPWLIEEAVKNIGENKIIFGSDEPYADLRIAKHCVELCNFDIGVKKKLFYKNVENIYGRNFYV